jgi:hypothetical protein
MGGGGVVKNSQLFLVVSFAISAHTLWSCDIIPYAA